MAARKQARPAARRSSGALHLEGDLWLSRAGQSFLGTRRIQLLEHIDRHGSITRAARASKLSYKGAWDMVDAMNNLAGEALVARSVGGSRGGGTQLTDYGRQLVELYRELQSGHRRVIDKLHAGMHDPQRLAQQLRSLGLRTSARNQLGGRVAAIRRGSVNADVSLDLGDSLQMTANVTIASVRELGLRVGAPALALIKSNFVLLAAPPAPRTSARNCLTGIIAGIHAGAVNSEVRIALPGERVLIAIVDREQVRELRLKRGSPCCALINAAHVLIAVND